MAWKSLALPVEHGGWGFVGEPVLLALAVAPSRATAGIAAGALFAFLARHPLKLALADRLRGLRTERTRAAEWIALAYALAAVVGLAMAWLHGRGAWWLCLAAAAPAALVQLGYDARLQGRRLAPELLGAAAPGSVAAAALVASGASWPVALGAWALLAARCVTAVVFVRARLRLDRDQPVNPVPALLGHVAALALAGVLVAAGTAPWLAAAAFAILLVRASRGLGPFRARVRPQALGFAEMGFGLLVVALLASGYRLSW